MVDIAASDPTSPGSREALRKVAFYAQEESDRKIAAGLLGQFEFAPTCTLPFQAIAIGHPIDQECGMFGSSTGDGQKAQNFVKNNFCAGTAYRDVTAADFMSLQDAADNIVQSGSARELPQNRAALKNIVDGLGEGAPVQFTGCILNAHYSNIGRGESVDCQMPDPAVTYTSTWFPTPMNLMHAKL